VLQIFLGYPSERLADARRIWVFLKSLQLNVWFDKESIIAGERWREVRERAQDASDLILHVISSEIEIRAGDVQRELKRTLDLATEKPFSALFTIPILVGGASVPSEFARYHYIDMTRDDWDYLLARSVARKFQQMQIAAPKEVDDFIASRSSEHGRSDLKIFDVTAARDLQADYFRYQFPGHYFEFVSAEIATYVLNDYYSWRRSETTVPDEDSERSTWHCQLQEFFRSGGLISIRCDSFWYSSGAAHGNTGITGLNFGGESIGKFDLPALLNWNLEALKFIARFSELNIRQQLLTQGYENDAEFLCDFDSWANDPTEGWQNLINFNFNERGITIYYNPYHVLAFAYGTFEVLIGWENLKTYFAEDFKNPFEALVT